MTEDLKPCPFCGGEAVVGSRNAAFDIGGMRSNGPEWVTIGCKKCCYYLCEAEDVFGRPPARAAKMFKLWNNRPLEEALPPDMQEIKDERPKFRERIKEVLDDEKEERE